MFTLSWLVGFFEEGTWKEVTIQVQEQTIEQALQQYLVELGRVSSIIRLSRLVNIMTEAEDGI